MRLQIKAEQLGPPEFILKPANISPSPRPHPWPPLERGRGYADVTRWDHHQVGLEQSGNKLGGGGPHRDIPQGHKINSQFCVILKFSSAPAAAGFR